VDWKKIAEVAVPADQFHCYSRYMSTAIETYAPTARTKLSRRKQRAAYDKPTVHGILDTAFVCHIGFVADSHPVVTPTLYVRVDETLYLHGSAGSRTLRALTGGAGICLTVSIIDGLVLARSAFRHSVNFRSVMVFGKARPVTDIDEVLRAMQLLVNRIAPGRWEEVRPPSEVELKQTTVLAVALNEVSAKVRTGPPIDDEQDFSRAVWAGVVPLKMRLGKPIADERVQREIAPIDLARFGATYRD
jgi:nitroimidazol reductase NimA-like FMN-containing flavoprotein (pyridoxamine 5'-phosphate oxidase superfamily)